MLIWLFFRPLYTSLYIIAVIGLSDSYKTLELFKADSVTSVGFNVLKLGPGIVLAHVNTGAIVKASKLMEVEMAISVPVVLIKELSHVVVVVVARRVVNIAGSGYMASVSMVGRPYYMLVVSMVGGSVDWSVVAVLMMGGSVDWSVVAVVMVGH